jgi:hypothetical protein
MPHQLLRSRPLQRTERELFAIACQDLEGTLYWIRVFESSITPRMQLGRRYETPNGMPAHADDNGLYLVFCRQRQQWIEVEPLSRK